MTLNSLEVTKCCEKIIYSIFTIFSSEFSNFYVYLFIYLFLELILDEPATVCQMPGHLRVEWPDIQWRRKIVDVDGEWRWGMDENLFVSICSRLGLSSWHTEAATPASRSREISSMWRDSCIDQSRSKSPWPDGSPHASKPQSSSFNRYFSYFKHSSTLRCSHFKLLRRGLECSIIEDARKIEIAHAIGNRLCVNFKHFHEFAAISNLVNVSQDRTSLRFCMNGNGDAHRISRNFKPYAAQF